MAFVSQLHPFLSAPVFGKSLTPRLPPPASPTHSFACSAPASVVKAMAQQNKVNAYDEGWKKQWFGAGIFAEDVEVAPINVVEKVEKKKLLSQVEKAGLLSKAESAGFTLSSIEKMGLLSKAEQLGLLSLAENLASTSPPKLASISLPLLVAAILTLLLIPDDSTLLLAAQNLLAALFTLSAAGLFVTSVVLSGLQED